MQQLSRVDEVQTNEDKGDQQIGILIRKPRTQASKLM